MPRQWFKRNCFKSIKVDMNFIILMIFLFIGRKYSQKGKGYRKKLIVTGEVLAITKLVILTNFPVESLFGSNF